MADMASSDNQHPVQRERVRTGRTDPRALARLLDEWMHDNETEQRETFETERRALDENRPAGYKLLA